MQPGEEAQCRRCGAYVTVPETSVEAEEESELAKMRLHRGEWKSRAWQFVPCPSCGGEELEKIVFWGVDPIRAGWLRYYLKAIPVRCKKCGNQFDGLTGRSVDEEMDTVRMFQYLSAGLCIWIGIILAAIIISKTVG